MSSAASAAAVCAVVMLSYASSVHALRAEQGAEASNRHEFPVAGLKAAAALAGQAATNPGAVGPWGIDAAVGASATSPSGGRAGLPPLRDSPSNIDSVRLRDTPRDNSWVDTGRSLWKSASKLRRASEKTAIQNLPQDWSENLNNLKVISKRRNSILFSATANQGGSSRKVMVRYVCPMTKQQVSDVNSEIQRGEHSGNIGLVAFHKAEVVDVDSMPLNVLQPKAHAYMLMEGSAGTMEQVSNFAAWKTSDAGTRLRLYIEIFRAVMIANVSPMGCPRIRPSEVMILGDLQQEESWHAALLGDFKDEDEARSELQQIRELGELALYMFFPNPFIEAYADEQTEFSGKKTTGPYDFDTLSEYANYKAIRRYDKSLAGLVKRMIDPEQKSESLNNLFLQLLLLGSEARVNADPRKDYPKFNDWASDEVAK